MKIAISAMIICTLCALKQSLCLTYIEVTESPSEKSSPDPDTEEFRRMMGMMGKKQRYFRQRNSYPPQRIIDEAKKFRRAVIDKTMRYQRAGSPDKDVDIKIKISTLVEQTLHDTERRIKSIENIKKKHRDDPPYKAGFILSMIKKARDVLNELFNVAVHHKDEWKALEQLKIFELIVHSNVDTTNLVRQLVEIHIQYLNSTSNAGHEGAAGRKRVVLLK